MRKSGFWRFLISAFSDSFMRIFLSFFLHTFGNSFRFLNPQHILTRSPHSPRYWPFASIKPQGPGGPASSPTSLVASLCKHHDAAQYSALSTHCWMYGPGRNQDKSRVTSYLAPVIERYISALVLVSVDTTFRTDSPTYLNVPVCLHVDPRNP
jgi:hypothetical protein